jgi:hypothetical protein
LQAFDAGRRKYDSGTGRRRGKARSPRRGAATRRGR